MEVNEKGMENLAIAVTKEAVEDYKRAVRKKDTYEAETIRKYFTTGNTFINLIVEDGTPIIEEVEKELYNGKKKSK